MTAPFSERFGGRAPRAFLDNDVTTELRNGLWNAVHQAFFAPHLQRVAAGYHIADQWLQEALRKIWSEILKERVDSMSPLWDNAIKPFRALFLDADWYVVYEIVESLPELLPVQANGTAKLGAFRKECNRVLEREMSVYRFVGTQLARLTAAEEIAAVEEARQLPPDMAVIQNHFDAALRLMSDRTAPDYRNSIKESISAVEGYCSLVAGQKTADLKSALREIEKRLPLHGGLRAGFLALYGYTSDENGVRHALMAESSLTFEDAKFMLVACSAFVNFLRGSLPS